MEHNAVFRFKDVNAEQIYHAIAPEMAGEVNFRSRAECWMESRDTLVLSVGASDIGALRASLNMWLRLINVAKEMQEIGINNGGLKI
jgi:tRNA threonylcarbamoyladenosine modification (KEOPS) complex  Pcc1 subunit